MAIDTVNKRASATNFFLFTILPIPDGTIGDADRIQIGGEYSGISVIATIIQSQALAIAEAKKNSDSWFPVFLVDPADMKTAEIGIVYDNIVCKYAYEAATSFTEYSVTSDDWKEVGEGKYWIKIGASEFTLEGKYEVSIIVSGSAVWNLVIEVTDKTKSEMIDDLVAVLADTNEMQGKLPTNYIMGSDDQDDHNAELEDWANGGRLDLLLDAILLDTGTTIQNVINTVNINTAQASTDLQNLYYSLRSWRDKFIRKE